RNLLRNRLIHDGQHKITRRSPNHYSDYLLTCPGKRQQGWNLKADHVSGKPANHPKGEAVLCLVLEQKLFGFLSKSGSIGIIFNGHTTTSVIKTGHFL